MRFFIALDLPADSRNQLIAVQQKIKELVPAARLTDPNKLHLTIAFVGEQLDEYKDHLIKIIEDAVQNISTFSVTPSYIDGFPHLHSAHTLWVGINGEIDELYKLRHHIKDGLESLDLPVDERRFVPHIAIAKIKNFHLNPEVEKKFEEIMSGDFHPIEVSSIKLFESIPDDGFHSHNTLAQIPLK